MAFSVAAAALPSARATGLVGAGGQQGGRGAERSVTAHRKHRQWRRRTTGQGRGSVATRTASVPPTEEVDTAEEAGVGRTSSHADAAVSSVADDADASFVESSSDCPYTATKEAVGNLASAVSNCNKPRQQIPEGGPPMIDSQWGGAG